MTLKVGRIPFLVCAPFFCDFLDREREMPDVEFIDGAPSEQCLRLKNGTIHLSPASSITFAQKPGAFLLAQNLCTSCSFEVKSVKLFSTCPINELNRKTVRLSAQSMTSVNLLKILLQERFNLRPNYKVGAYEPADEACLIIGDLALEENERKRFAYSYDLGSLWQDWQGVPFVFGAWIVSKLALKSDLQQTLQLYMQRTTENVQTFSKTLDSSVAKWIKRYPVNLPLEVIRNYFSSLDYSFTDERKYSLSLFFEHAKSLKLIEQVPKLEFL